LSLGFDHRDRLLGGGITYGELSYTSGSMRNANDFANTKGGFNKSNLDLSRQQALTSAMSVYVRYSVQHANKNLDSSEDMFLGGSSGVRAYPQGEASGDKGHLATLEARYQYGSFAPYVFYDHGKVETYARPTEQLISETRTLSGSGVGLRYVHSDWRMDVAAAWRKQGGIPTSDRFKDPKPRLLLTLGYRF
jgi:hemolysin activation/secretion protein